MKSCVRQKCQQIFSKPGMTDLLDGCLWFVDWFEVADNPSFVYKEIPCPDALVNRTTMDRRPLNDVSNSCGN